MLIKMQKKMWTAGLELTEKSLEKMIKDDSFLQISSMGMNSSLWWQRNFGKGLEILLKQMNLPSQETIKKIHHSIYQLEKELSEANDKIKILENTIESMKAKPAKATKVRSRKKTAEVTM